MRSGSRWIWCSVIDNRVWASWKRRSEGNVGVLGVKLRKETVSSAQAMRLTSQVA